MPGPQIVTSSPMKVILLKRGRALLLHPSSIPMSGPTAVSSEAQSFSSGSPRAIEIGGHHTPTPLGSRFS